MACINNSRSTGPLKEINVNTLFQLLLKHCRKNILYQCSVDSGSLSLAPDSPFSFIRTCRFQRCSNLQFVFLLIRREGALSTPNSAAMLGGREKGAGLPTPSLKQIILPISEMTAASSEHMLVHQIICCWFI